MALVRVVEKEGEASLSETLYKALPDDVGRGEWNTFVEGLALSVPLLIKLLQYKYRAQKSIRIKPLAIQVYEKTPLVMPKPLPFTSSSGVTHEVTVVVHHYKTGPVTMLLVRRRVYPFIFFTALPPVNEDEETVRYILNNRYLSPIDNGFFVFDFMDALLRGDPMANNLLYPGELGEPTATTSFTQRAKAQAVAMIQQLVRPLRIKETLITLYRALNHDILALPRLLQEGQDKKARRIIERKKQRFYRWIEDVFIEERKEDSSILQEEKEEASRFFAMPILLQRDDPIQASEEASKGSDALFRELLALVQFIETVVMRSDQSVVPDLRLTVQGIAYTVHDVKLHMAHLRFRILNRVDSLNTPPIDTLEAHQLAFTQADYERLVTHHFITYNIMSHTLTPLLHPEAILLGPRHAETLLSQDLSVEKRRLLFWILEGVSHTQEQTPYYGLLVVHQPEGLLPCQRSLYIPSKSVTEMTEINEFSKKLLERVDLRCFRSHIDSHYGIATNDYYYSTWYAALLIKVLSERMATEPITSDWVGQVQSILAKTTTTQLFDTIEMLMIETMRAILSLLFSLVSPPISAISLSSQTSRHLDSHVSDVARLSINDEYIDDVVIRDMINTSMRLDGPHCYVFDVAYWGGVIDTPEKRASTAKRNKIFKNPAIRLILLPVNQKDYHWSLAIIDLPNRLVSFYSSLAYDDYYETPFVDLMKAYLDVQLPGSVFTFRRLENELQAPQSSDCALFVLNKMAQLCVSPFYRVQYTRDSVRLHLKRRLTALILDNHQQQEGNAWLGLFSVDLCTRYLNKKSKLLWPSISGNPVTLRAYRAAYLDDLKEILMAMQLYSEASITNLMTTLQSLNNCRDTQEVESLFNSLLILKNQEEEVVKRKREPAIDEPVRERKSRKCLVYDAQTRHAITQLIDEVLWLKNHYATLDQRAFADRFSEYILAAYLTDLSVREDLSMLRFLELLIERLFREATRESLEEVVQEYVICREPEVERVLLTCIYCNNLTSRIDPVSRAAYCSDDCLHRSREQK